MNKSAKIEENDLYNYNLYKAAQTLWYFNELIHGGFSGYNSVKFKNKEGVYVWLENVNIEDIYFVGELAENGISQQVLIDDVIDWMIIDEGRLIGGYTIRHYRDTLDEDTKVSFDNDFGVKIDDGNDFFKPNLATPEGAIITIENFYSEKNLMGVLSCKDFMEEAKHLLEERSVKVTEELQLEIAATLKASFIAELESNGFPSFNDIERNFSLIEKQDNKCLISEKVIYPDGFTVNNTLWVAYSEVQEWKVLNNIE